MEGSIGLGPKQEGEIFSTDPIQYVIGTLYKSIGYQAVTGDNLSFIVSYLETVKTSIEYSKAVGGEYYEKTETLYKNLFKFKRECNLVCSITLNERRDPNVKPKQ